MFTRLVLAPVRRTLEKLIAPGLPPICELAVQFAAGRLARFGFIFTSEGPAPSGPTGQSPSTPYFTKSMSRLLLSRNSSVSPLLERRPLNGPRMLVRPLWAFRALGEM